MHYMRPHKVNAVRIYQTDKTSSQGKSHVISIIFCFHLMMLSYFSRFLEKRRKEE